MKVIGIMAFFSVLFTVQARKPTSEVDIGHGLIGRYSPPVLDTAMPLWKRARLQRESDWTREGHELD